MSGDEIKQERHKARQQKVKEQVDAKIAAAQEEKGLLLIITGNGKGNLPQVWHHCARGRSR